MHPSPELANDVLAWVDPGVGRFERALLLDRDGVINVKIDDGYVLDFDRDFRLIDAFERAMAPFCDARIPAVIVSNQSCVGRGLIGREAMREVMTRVIAALRSRGIRIAGYVICPHAPDARCACRKPEPGLLFEAERRFGIRLGESAFIGDSATDATAGERAGCPTFLVDAADEARYFLAFEQAYRLTAAPL